jgi:hypothetical protein
VQVGKVPVPLVEIEAVADEKLVRNREADIAEGKVFDEAAIGAVEQRHGREGCGVAEGERLAEVVEGEAGIDDVLDHDDMAAGQLGVEILQEPDPGMAALVGAGGVARELQEVEAVLDPDGAREIGDEDEARLERRHEQRVEAVVLAPQLAPELTDACRQLLAREVDLAEAWDAA